MPKETIIILDQDSNTQWTLKTLLESEGYMVIAANTIEAALRSFSEFEISGLITEYWIGRSSTLETIRRCKKAFPQAYVMMLTHGEMQEDTYAEVINAGADDCFLKPLSIKKILLHLRKGLRKRLTLLQEQKVQAGESISSQEKLSEVMSP